MEADEAISVLQTTVALEIRSPQFEIALPGIWIQKEATADHVVYCGRSGNRWIWISLFPFTRRLSIDERKKEVNDMLELRKGAEHKISHGESDVSLSPPYGDEDVTCGSALSVNLSMGLVSFTRLIADEEKMLCIHWQANGFSEPPSLTPLWEEFEKVASTVLV